MKKTGILLSLLALTFAASAQENNTEKVKKKRKNGVYLSLFGGLNTTPVPYNLERTQETSPVASVVEDFEMTGFYGADFGLNLEIDFGTHSSLYIEQQVSVEGGEYINNADEQVQYLVPLGVTKIMFGHDLGANRQFTFRGGLGIQSSAIPVINGSASPFESFDPETDIRLTPALMLGLRWNLTQWLMLGVEHRRMMQFPNQVRIRFDEFQNIENFQWVVSSFRASLILRVPLWRYRNR